jgi:succinyl-CoA synthetase beta subunit
MNLHEYQAKELLQQFGVAIPKGIKVTSQQEALEAAKEVREGGTVGGQSPSPRRWTRQGGRRQVRSHSSGR